MKLIKKTKEEAIKKFSNHDVEMLEHYYTEKISLTAKLLAINEKIKIQENKVKVNPSIYKSFLTADFVIDKEE